MVTISPVRSTISPVQPQIAERTQEADVRDADGRLLVRVELTEPLDGDRLLLGEVDDGAPLMAYYFGRGGREVLLMRASRATHARLDTRWAGSRREWWLDLQG